MIQPKTASKEPRQLSPEKAEAILSGGMKEFLVHGYAATSMDRVAAAAGVSKATVYSHFKDKEGLFIALIEQLVQNRFRSLLETSSQTVPPEPSIFLRQLAHRFLDMNANEPQFLNLVRLIIGESGRFPQLARAFVRNIEQNSFRILHQYLAACPQLKLADSEAAARIFIGALVHFTIVQDMLHGKDILPMESDRLVDNLVSAIVADSVRTDG
jgi:TetR/AcrR family transcriptional regulator, regulator of autoinduction and epiphytic fitness